MWRWEVLIGCLSPWTDHTPPTPPPCAPSAHCRGRVEEGQRRGRQYDGSRRTNRGGKQGGKRGGKKEDGRRKKEEGRRKNEEGRSIVVKTY